MASANEPAEAVSSSPKTNLLDLDRKAMEAFFQANGAKAFHGRNVLKWIHKHGVTDFAAMTDLSKALRGRLNELAEVRLPEVVFDQPSRDGTHKWLLQLTCPPVTVIVTMAALESTVPSLTT